VFGRVNKVLFGFEGGGCGVFGFLGIGIGD